MFRKYFSYSSYTKTSKIVIFVLYVYPFMYLFLSNFDKVLNLQLFNMIFFILLGHLYL